MHFAPWGLDANASTLFDVVPRTVLWLGAAAIALLLAGPKLHVGPATALLIAFAGWAVASAIWSEQPLRTLSAGTGFLCTLVAIAAIHQTVGLHRALRTLAIVAGAICLASLVAGVQNLDGSLVGQPTEFGTSRLAGVTEEPGALALVAGLGIVAAIADARRLSSFVIVAVCAAALAWSQTQTVFIALGCVALLSLWGRRGPTRVLTGLAVGSAVVALLLWTPDAGPNLLRVRDGVYADATTLSGRGELWDVTAELIVDRPLAGHGYASSPALYATALDPASGPVDNAHNLWLELGVGTGIIGVLLVASAVVVAIALGDRHAAGCTGMRRTRYAVGGYVFFASLASPISSLPGVCITVLALYVVDSGKSRHNNNRRGY